MSQERPEGWVEPVHEALLRPASFFGAAPRHVVVVSLGLCALVMVIAAMTRFWALMGIVLLVAAVIQVSTAALTFIEPHWFELLSEWLKSPQTKVDP
jgi:type IV secretory pathway TrbD component